MKKNILWMLAAILTTRVVPRIYISDAQGIIRYMHLDMSMPSAETLAEEVGNTHEGSDPL